MHSNIEAHLLLSFNHHYLMKLWGLNFQLSCCAQDPLLNNSSGLWKAAGLPESLLNTYLPQFFLLFFTRPLGISAARDHGGASEAPRQLDRGQAQEGEVQAGLIVQRPGAEARVWRWTGAGQSRRAVPSQLHPHQVWLRRHAGPEFVPPDRPDRPEDKRLSRSDGM